MNRIFHTLMVLFASERQRRCRAPLDTMLEGKHLILRAADPRDARAWIALRSLSAPALAPFEPEWPKNCLTGDFYIRQWRRFSRRWIQDREYSLLIFLRKESGGEGALAGGITVSDIRRNAMQTGSLGYWLGLPYRGQGLMREAVALVVEFAFWQLKLNRLEATCLPENEPSLKLLRESGFSPVGLSRQHMQIAGKWRDHLLFEKLKSES